MQKLKNQTVTFSNKPAITATATIVGPKEGHNELKDYFDTILKCDYFEEKTFERAERKMFRHVIDEVIRRGGKKTEDVDFIFSGDLLNQIISSTFSAREFDCMHVGLYSACATMAESLAVGALFVDGGYAQNAVCATGSHFSTAERQYRYPLEYGSLRPAFSQWTVTGAGAALLSANGEGPKITKATFGKVVDFNILDANNMGAAMAPAALHTLKTHFQDTGTTPEDYDLILTGDLGLFGSKVLRDLAQEQAGFKLGENYKDCGALIYKEEPKIFQGGSGAGCSAVVLNGFVYKKMLKGELKKVLFTATGALLNTMTAQQGDTIPAIAHAVVIENI